MPVTVTNFCVASLYGGLEEDLFFRGDSNPLSRRFCVARDGTEL